MNLLSIAWKNLRYRPLNTLLSLTLFATGTGLISLVLLVASQLQRQFDRNLAGIDLVIGAKGSPLQLILSTMYHLDSPTGNIPLSQARPFLRPAHPLIARAVPLSLGDSYRGRRIVGTDTSFFKLYELRLSSGRLWQQPMEVVAGSEAARALNLQLGSRFKSAHGLADEAFLTHEEAPPFVLVGILAPTGTVADRLLLTDTRSIWWVHAQHTHHAADSLLAAWRRPLHEIENQAITALLLQFKGRSYQTLNLARQINENTNMLAASPPLELSKVYMQIARAVRLIQYVAWVIIALSALSVFIALYQSLQERRYELALLRVMGATPRTLATLILVEGVLLAGTGALLGLLLSHAGMSALRTLIAESGYFPFSPFVLLPAEGWLLLASLCTGILAALLPAWQASHTDIAETLAEK